MVIISLTISKKKIKGTDAVGFFSHARDGYVVFIKDTIDKNNQIGLKRVPCCKDGVYANDKHFNEHKDDYIRYFVILNEGNEQNIYQIPRDLCYWREVLIDDTETSDTEQYKNKFMEAVACLKAGRSFTFKTRAQVEVDGKLVKKYKTITISGEVKKVEINDIIEEKLEKQEKEFNGNNINQNEKNKDNLNNPESYNININQKEENNKKTGTEAYGTKLLQHSLVPQSSGFCGMFNWCNCEYHIEEGNMNLDINNGQVSGANNLEANCRICC